METLKIDITYKEPYDNRVNNETEEDEETNEHIPVQSIAEDDNDDEIQRFRVRGERRSRIKAEENEVKHKNCNQKALVNSAGALVNSQIDEKRFFRSFKKFSQDF
ncbi:hypothetical protein QVD17_40269 [Tagetes erecta]|uniref:Uncharacterized protein n=1 Tax=Tagetes erecta TaxID=13708 RepID=A0AAD8JRT0_TARER|nr:hypothetical protein QVD17_40269 [Tagetes erecta]